MNELGKCEADIGTRDAIHVAVICCESDGALEPGDYVQLSGDLEKAVRIRDAERAHGIVDPWQPGNPEDGRFWVMLRPGIANGIRHDFNVRIFGDLDWGCGSVRPGDSCHC